MFSFLPLAAQIGLSTAGGFIKRHAPLILFGLFVVVFAASAYFLVNHGVKLGKAEEQVKTERIHTQTIREVRADETVAQKAADSVGAQVTAQINDQRQSTDAQLQEIRDELAKAKAAQPSGVALSAVPDSVRAHSNSIIDSANRAADYAGPAD